LTLWRSCMPDGHSELTEHVRHEFGHLVVPSLRNRTVRPRRTTRRRQPELLENFDEAWAWRGRLMVLVGSIINSPYELWTGRRISCRAGTQYTREFSRLILCLTGSGARSARRFETAALRSSPRMSTAPLRAEASPEPDATSGQRHSSNVVSSWEVISRLPGPFSFARRCCRLLCIVQ
jgi:hypothetical protein